jgi:hypothetical protein
MMKRAVLCLIALAAGACASNSPQEVQAYCARFAGKYMAYGAHDDLNAYREDLMSTCMAMKGVPYAKAPAGKSAKAD